MKYVKLIDKNPKFNKPLQYGWVLKVECFEDLMIYDDVTNGRWHNTFDEFMKAHEGLKHHTPRSFALELTALNKNTSIVNALGIMCSEDFQNKMNCINKYGYIYAQYRNVSSYFFPYEHIIELQERKFVDNGSLWIPKDEGKKLRARYMQWANGRHWYAKIGDIDIMVDGEQKWNTKVEAQEAVKKWKNGNESIS